MSNLCKSAAFLTLAGAVTAALVLTATANVANARGGGGMRNGGAYTRAPTVRDHRAPAAPVVREHRDPPAPVVRDHREPTGPVVRDHRDPTGPVVRDHRDPPAPVVRDHRDPPAPVVRDHRPKREASRRKAC